MDADKEVASGYGEADIEAKAMAKAESDPAGKHQAIPSSPPSDALIKAKGTTETDIASNIEEKKARSSKR